MGGWSGEEEGRSGEGGYKRENKTKTDKECQALKTGMLQLYVSHLATSPPHHFSRFSRCAL